VRLILLSLAGKPRHGYSIMKDVDQMSQGRVRLSTGTLYGTLRRLLDEGWIEGFSEPASSRRRRGISPTRLAAPALIVSQDTVGKNRGFRRALVNCSNA
jgi:hypothetical protein